MGWRSDLDFVLLWQVALSLFLFLSLEPRACAVAVCGIVIRRAAHSADLEEGACANVPNALARVQREHGRRGDGKGVKLKARHCTHLRGEVGSFTHPLCFECDLCSYDMCSLTPTLIVTLTVTVTPLPLLSGLKCTHRQARITSIQSWVYSTDCLPGQPNTGQSTTFRSPCTSLHSHTSSPTTS